MIRKQPFSKVDQTLTSQDSFAQTLMNRLKLNINAKAKRKLLIISVSIFVFATLLALYQPVHIDVNNQSSNLNRFFYPHENNPNLKLPKIDADINDIEIIGNDIWLVGSGGLILHSSDSGKCWLPQGRWITPSLKKIQQNKSSNFNSINSLICAKSLTAFDRVFNSVANNHSANNISFFPSVQAAVNKYPEENERVPKQSSKTETTESQQQIQQQPQRQFQQQQQHTQDYLTNDESYNVTQQTSFSSVSDFVQQQSLNSLLAVSKRIKNDYYPLFNSIAFMDKNIGVAVANNGVVIRTENGGKDWFSIGHLTKNNLNSVAYIPANRNQRNGKFIAVGDQGQIIYSNDLGITWWVKPFSNKNNINYIHFIDQSISLMIGDKNTIGTYSNLTDNWKNTIPPSVKKHLNVFAMNNKNTIIIADNSGHIYKTDSSWSEPKKISQAIKGKILSVAINDNNIALATTNTGEIYRSENSNNNWQLVYQKAERSINYLSFSDQGYLLAAGDKGLLIRSNDAGLSWHNLTNPALSSEIKNKEYSIDLAYWWYFVSFLCGSFIIVLIWPKNNNQEDDEGIAGIAASDRPLEPGDPGAANLAEISNDITSFLSNPKTTAPLTLAVTGPWGCGKSSLMNLVKAGLEERQFSPVWFNAWHHQKGEQLLASLFAHIKEQAIPGWFSLDGLWFRAKLAIIRGRRHWFIVALMLFLLFMAWSINQQSVSHFFILFGRAFSNPSHFWEVPWDSLIPTAVFTHSQDWLQNIASLLGIGAPLLALSKAVKGFGLNPENLVSIDHRQKNQKGYDPGARARFASEFKDVTEALGENKMVIFIDDLDRCSQDNLIDILENINFISSSGDCYLILGMAPKYIKACVANAYKTLAQSIAEKENFEKNIVNTSATANKHKFNFANQYLEKMINIEVAVPTMQDIGITQLLSQGAQLQNDEPHNKLSKTLYLQNAFDWLIKKSGRAAQLAIILFAISYGWQYGEKIPPKPLPNDPTIYELGSLNKSSLLKLFSAEKLKTANLEESIKNLSNDNNDEFSLLLQVNSETSKKAFKIASLGDSNDDISLLLKLAPNQNNNYKKDRLQDLLHLQKSDKPQMKGATLNQPITKTSSMINEEKIEQQSTQQSAIFSKPKDIDKTRISVKQFIIWLLIFVFFVTYIKRREHLKYSKDSDSFKDSLLNWTPWIQIKQETPRAIKRFLNHLRFQSIRNRKQIKESLLVAAATIYFFDKNWLTNEVNLKQLCQGKVSELLQQKYSLSKSELSNNQKINSISAQLQTSLDGTDLKALLKNRLDIIQVLTGHRI